MPWSPTSLRPEDELLICCARTAMDPERASRVSTLLASGLDWVYLLRAARWHRVVPLLHWHLNRLSPSGIPAAIRRLLREEFQRNTRYSSVLTAELLKLLNQMEARGIPAVPFKGPVLASTAYGHLGLRDFGDLDILVQKADVRRASSLLEERGFRPQFELGAHHATFVQRHWEHAFTRGPDGLVVDLHWAVAPAHFSFALDSEAIWRRLRRASLGGREVLTLSPEDLLVALCLHGAKHSWEQLNWLCDLGEVVRAAQDVVWEAVLDDAEARGRNRMILLGLDLVRTLLGIDLPAPVASSLARHPEVRRLGARVTALLLRGPRRRGTFVERDLLYLGSMERLRDRLRYCADQLVVPTPLEWSWIGLPHGLSRAYYLVRPTRLALKYGGRLARRATGMSTARRRTE
jgi:hypothetical protein